mgnify:CR=1 FL=1
MLQLNAFTLVIFVVYYSMIRNDNKQKGVNDMIELTCKKCDDVTIKCDEDTIAVTCSMCSMVDVGCV